jgi:hypothetical protein
LAGLVSQASRNLYALTELGETALLVAAGLAGNGESPGGAWKKRHVPIAEARQSGRKPPRL